MALSYTYVSQTNTYTVSGHDGTDTNLTIPDIYNGPNGNLPVTLIAANAFLNATNLNSVIVGANITNIQSSAFSGCSNLTSVTLQYGLSRISGSAFANCTKLNSITIPNTVNNIGSSVFIGCSNLTSATFTNNAAVTTIPTSTFNGCTKLNNFTVPNNITVIGGNCFYNCTSLTNINLGSSLIQINASAFELCTSLVNISFPSTLNRINTGAFSGCSSLVNITLPDSVTLVFGAVFYGCSNLVNVQLSKNITSIGASFFEGCTKLNSIIIPDKVTSILYAAFRGCSSLTSIVIPKSVKTFQDAIFENCTSLKDIYFLGDNPDPDSLTVDVLLNTDPFSKLYYYSFRNGWPNNLGGESTFVVMNEVNEKFATFGLDKISKGSISFIKQTGKGSISIGLIKDGLTQQTAGNSAYQIKRDFPNSTDGLYWIKNPNINGGTPFRIYADMTTDSGGWTLIMLNNFSSWTSSNAILRNESNPPTSPNNRPRQGEGADGSDNYSIIAYADYIKKSSSGFQYMIDAYSRGRWGGIWTANGNYSFVNANNTQTNITLNTKFDNWEYTIDHGIDQRMPWYKSDTNLGIITTDDSAGANNTYWWGTLITAANWSPTPWIESQMPHPGIIWYWVR